MNNEQNILIEQANKMLELKEKKEQLTQELKNINELFEKEEENLFDMMFNLDIDLIRLNGKTLSRKIDEYPKIIDKDRFFEFLRESGHGSLIIETVNVRTLKSWFNENKELIKGLILGETENFKDALLKVFKDKKIGIRKSNK